MTTNQRRHEKIRLLICVLFYLWFVALFYMTKWAYEYTGTSWLHTLLDAEPNAPFLNGQSFPFLYVLCIAVLAYVVSFVDLLFDKRD